MNSDTGKLMGFDSEKARDKAVSELGLLPVNAADITKKQLQDMMVSKYDGKSVLGKIRQEQIRRRGRNNPCHCGSGRKYKKCCLNKVV